MKRYVPVACLGGVVFACTLMMRAETTNGVVPSTIGPASPPDQTAAVAAGRQLFLANCAHCHAQDASGDEGPDLHGLKISDARITRIISEGIPGEMPRFGQKLAESEVKRLIQYLRSLPISNGRSGAEADSTAMR